MFLLWLRQLPCCGDWTPASVPSPAKDRSSPTETPVFPPSSFILLSFAWFYIFFSTGQVLLSALSCCSACTSVSEGVFLMYLWREMYSTSTYSSTILFSLLNKELLINQSTIFQLTSICLKHHKGWALGQSPQERHRSGWWTLTSSRLQPRREEKDLVQKMDKCSTV